MYVKEIHIESFRHLKDVHLGPFAQPPEQSDLVVLAGPNGGGKSSILELLGYGLSNSWSLSWSLRRSFPSNAFEIAIAVTPEERDLVKQYIETTQGQYAEDVLRYFEENGTYYRAYNYTAGNYYKEASLHNQIHNLVTAALRNYYSRSLGFFLKSDRYYPPEGFRRDRLFEYNQMNRLDYIWNMAFNTSDNQYRDMFEVLVQQRYHYFRQLGAYHHRLKQNQHDKNEQSPHDPLQIYDELLQKLFPGYQFVDGNEEIPTNLFIQIPTGEVIPFQDLSSGEKEVFFLLSFFLRHNVSNAVIMIDEPELHLHPELARLLIRTMQVIRPGNQIWLATHNTEIIDEAGRDRIFYISRDDKTRKSIVVPGTDEEEAVRQLKNLFGYSGYIGISKTIVFLEGIDSSSDRKMFSSLFPAYGNLLKFVPSKTSENLARLNNAILSILASNLGWMQFYLLRDRDYLTQEAAQAFMDKFSGRLYVLSRYHIENYLLDEDVIAKVQEEIFHKPTDPKTVELKLRSIARKLSAEVLRDMVSFRLNAIYRPQDFSLGKYMEGEPIFNEEGKADSERTDQFRRQLSDQIATINSALLQSTKPDALEELTSKCQEEVKVALFASNAGWKYLFPGRRLLEEYAKSEGLGKPPILQNSLIKELSTSPEKLPNELRKVIQTITEGREFS